MTRFAALVGLAREARLLRRASGLDETALYIAVGGADPARTCLAVKEVLSSRPDAVISFGLAGGLAAELPAGALVCPRRIVAPGGAVHQVDKALWKDFADRLSPLTALDCALAGSDTAVATTQAKQALREATSACIVDMESHILAESAMASSVPLLVVRAVCDPAAQAIPQPILRLMDARGRLRWRGLPSALVHWRAMAALARHSRQAERSLGKAAKALGSLVRDRASAL